MADVTCSWGTETVERSVGGRRFRVFTPRPSCVGAVIDGAVATWSEREHLVQGATRWTFGQVDRAIGRATTRLVDAGVRPGDRVGLLGANSPAWVVAFFALQRMGAVAVLGNGWWTADDLAAAFDETDTSLVLADTRRRERVPADLTVRELGALVEVDGGTAMPPRAEVGEDAASCIVFTSGTTSRPKAAVLSHRSTVANLHNVLLRTRQLPPLDATRAAGVSLCAVPLFHISGVQTILQHLVVGGTLVFLDGRFDPRAVLDLIESERVTAWTAVPTMLSMVLDQPGIEHRDLSSVRSLAVGGAPVPPELLARAHERFTHAAPRLAVSYGSTEAGGTVATGLRGESDGALVPLSTVDVHLAPSDGRVAGELLVRAPTLMDGYLGVPASEQPIDAEGWLHTGDLAELDDQGRLRIVGRLKDVIIRGGENVAAAQVEATLRAHPEVADAAVVGIPHVTWGEEVGALVALHPGATVSGEELRAFADARLARYAVPTRWIVSRDALPMTETGKVATRAVREALVSIDGPAADPDSTEALDELRADTRRWLETSCPPAMRTPVTDPSELVFGGRDAELPSDDARLWLERMAARGWTAPTWPREYGGAGLTARQAAVVAEELQRAGCRQPLVSVHGIGMLGPVLLEFGTEEQRFRFLPPTARGDIRWCQGFSEPAVGSDLASVRTRARRDGDEYVLDGQKLWTSYATVSDWIFVLARTDAAAPKRDGLSFFLVDLRSDGVSVRPIRLLSGESEFCEVFLDGVHVDARDRVGEEGAGWRIARLVLTHERQMFGQGTGLMSQRLGAPDFVALARAHLDAGDGPIPDVEIRDSISRLDIELDCIRAALRRARRGGAVVHPSVLKHTLSELMQAQADLATRIAGTRALGWAGAAFDDDLLALTRDHLFSRAWTIAGGSTEIQLNIIARRILGLPHLGPERDE